MGVERVRASAAHRQEGRAGPAGRLLTAARRANGWLRAGWQDAQAQTVRDYTQALHHAFTVKGRGRPKVKKAKTALPSLQFSRNGFSIKEGRLVLPKGTTIPVVWSRDLPCDPTRVRVYQDCLGHWYASFVVRREVEPAPEAAGGGIDWGVQVTATASDPAYDLPHIGARRAAMTCSGCGTRTKDRLSLDRRVFSCRSCGLVLARDRNAARTILAVAERGHASVENVRHPGPPLPEVVSGAV